ncbi:hypothetical protein [Rubritalea tangerina]|uniref:hypothetical protein n=1 Tax=Rubritalea tangerina TaxID=430798 RepID=UPI0036220C58
MSYVFWKSDVLKIKRSMILFSSIVLFVVLSISSLQIQESYMQNSSYASLALSLLALILPLLLPITFYRWAINRLA